MLETVGIVLNEREKEKEETALKLVKHLEQKGITSFRYEIGPNIVQTLFQKRPRFLILDYILGDYSTGLDVLKELQKIPAAERPKSFMLTDEPSALVASESFRLGVSDYLPINNTHSLTSLVLKIENIRCLQETPLHSLNKKTQELEDLVFASSSMKQILHQMKSHIKQEENLLIVYGPKGIGKKTLAYSYLQELNSDHKNVSEINLKHSLEKANSLFSEDTLRSHFILTNFEYDDGEYLEFIATNLTFIKKRGFSIIATTSEEETARAWGSLLHSPIIEIPELGEKRKDDFLALTQKITKEISKTYGTKLSSLPKESLLWLSEQQWNYGVHQLREVLYEAYIAVESDKSAFQVNLENSFERSILYNSLHSKKSEVTKQEAMSLLETHSYRSRIVAAKLGIGIKELQTIIN